MASRGGGGSDMLTSIDCRPVREPGRMAGIGCSYMLGAAEGPLCGWGCGCCDTISANSSSLVVPGLAGPISVDGGVRIPPPEPNAGPLMLPCRGELLVVVAFTTLTWAGLAGCGARGFEPCNGRFGVCWGGVFDVREGGSLFDSRSRMSIMADGD